MFLNLFGIKIFALKVDLDLYNGAIKIRFLGKVKLLRFGLNVEEKDSVLHFAKGIDRNLLYWIDCKNINFKAEIGTSNALYSIFIVQSLRIAYASLISILKCSQKIENYERIVPRFDGETFLFNFESLFEICITNLIIYFLKNMIGKIKKRYRSKYGY